MKLKRGDVYWAALPGGRRPVVVLTRETAIPLLNSVTVAPVTRTIREIPSEILLTPMDGMPSACAVALDNVQVLPKMRLRGRITSLSPQRLEQLCEAIRFALGC